MFTLHFVGGPLDGQKYAWPDEPPPTFYVPREPTPSAFGPFVDPPPPVLYERRPGVVAGEAMYDWQPDRPV